MNASARPLPRRLLCCLTLLAGLTGCASTQKQLIFEKTIPLPTGRFAGPVELELPRRPPTSLRDYEIQMELSSACGPLLRVSYPDGEVGSVGTNNTNWQNLLALRSESSENQEAPPTTSAAIENTSEVPAAAGPGALPPAQGRWQQTVIESWPGQLEFIRRRDLRCSRVKRYRRTYATAFDETGRLTIWAEIPQELADAQLSVRVYEVIDQDREERVAKRQRNKERKRARAEQRRLQAQATVSVRAEITPPKPRPPMPKPKKETPKAAKADGASWASGHWSWHGSKGKWVWVRGYWLAPAHAPALKAEGQGGPPLAGCTWHDGQWSWVQGNGSWRWTPGYWNPPPPKPEVPGTPPVPESSWIPGTWQRTKLSFRWSAGRWGKPRDRTETPPPPPHQGATWQRGSWLQIKGQWIWSPGYYAGSRKAPPAPRKEVAGPSPETGAVWLRGYWRWAESDYRWVPGHWERPPGAGYTWIPDPPDPTIGHSIGGQWKIIVDVPVNVEVRP